MDEKNKDGIRNVLESLTRGKSPKLEELRGDEKNHRNHFSDLPPINDETAEIIDYIFVRFMGIVRMAHYQSNFEVVFDSLKREYTYELMSAGIKNKSDIDKALDGLRKKGAEFIPSPSEFVEMCKPSPDELGIPDVYWAYKLACEYSHPASDKQPMHPVVYHAWKQTGSNQMRELPRHQNFPIFERNYNIALRKFQNGEILGEIQKGIGDDSHHKHGSYRGPTKIGINALDSLKKHLK